MRHWHKKFLILTVGSAIKVEKSEAFSCEEIYHTEEEGKNK